MARHITPAMLQMLARLSREGRTQLEIAAITGVSQGAISKILKRSRETGTTNQKSRRHRERSTNARDRFLLRMVHYNWFQSSPQLRVEFNRRIGRRISVCAINWWLLTARYLSRRPARCPRPTEEHHRRRGQWPRRHCDWDPRLVIGGTMSSLTSSASNHIAVMVGIEFTGLTGREILMLVCNKQISMWCHRLGVGHPSLRGQERVSHC